MSTSSSSLSSEQRKDGPQSHKKPESLSSNIPKDRQPSSPLVRDIIENLSNDISTIIRSKDETIHYLFMEREVTSQNIIKTENLHLQEKAKLLQTSGIEIAKSTAHIWELHLKVKKLEGENSSLASKFEAESFRLKKDIVDLRTSKTESESKIQRVKNKLSEARSDFEEQLAAKEKLLGEDRLEAAKKSKELEARSKTIKELTKEILELNRDNDALSREVGDLKVRLGGYKRTWEQLKEGMDEMLDADGQRSKKFARDKA
ncbi:hypothetical protein BKA65DRAFT_473153 [Rhexocercosporidium sp. MPI-PUGE-AT-0058]|nr:hypothetical protein BKA65DRAFT_473153 [Rhexocercosporidium sp. MPI-PUGE-AT-0058]